MAKILSFRHKDAAASGQDYLTDETEKLSFQTAEDGAVSLGEMSRDSLPDILPDPKKDWSNQELADLFRVRQLLGGAGVPVDTLRGITDEGDPWFVYCHLNGDVFIHMARIDGLYVLDSPNVHRPLRGRDFNELIADFTSDALPSYASAGDSDVTQRVVKLERGGKVRLHPSAMLAALIWTLFMASEELVMLIENKQPLPSDDLLDFSDIISADVEAQVIEADTADLDNMNLVEVAKDLSHDVDHAAPEAHGQIREAMTQQGLAMQQNAYAMGLSTIAIAMGFMSEAVLLDNQRKVFEGLKNIGFTQYAASTEGGPQLEQVAGESGDALLAKLAEFLGLDLGQDTELAEAANPRQEAVLLAQEEQLLAEETAPEVAAIALKTQDLVKSVTKEVELAEAPVEAQAEAPEAQETLASLAAAQKDADVPTMSELLDGTIEMEEFQLGQTTVLASFDLSAASNFSWSDFVVTQRTTDHRAFDAQAQAFIDFIQAKDTEVGVITIANEIIMIDRGAFRQNGADTYTFSWETDGGQVISMIGLRSEFEQFDLIA